jgi:hypothetical protein
MKTDIEEGGQFPLRLSRADARKDYVSQPGKHRVFVIISFFRASVSLYPLKGATLI